MDEETKIKVMKAAAAAAFDSLRPIPNEPYGGAWNWEPQELADAMAAAVVAALACEIGPDEQWPNGAEMVAAIKDYQDKHDPEMKLCTNHVQPCLYCDRDGE